MITKAKNAASVGIPALELLTYIMNFVSRDKMFETQFISVQPLYVKEFGAHLLKHLV